MNNGSENQKVKIIIIFISVIVIVIALIGLTTLGFGNEENDNNQPNNPTPNTTNLETDNDNSQSNDSDSQGGDIDSQDGDNESQGSDIDSQDGDNESQGSNSNSQGGGNNSQGSGNNSQGGGNNSQQGSDVNTPNNETVNKIMVEISNPDKTLIEQGTDIVYSVKFSSKKAIKIVNLSNKVEITDNSGNILANQPTVVIGTVTGTSNDLTRQVSITIKTNTLENGAYKLKIKSGAATNSSGVSNTANTLSQEGFSVHNLEPSGPIIMSANITELTKEDVQITITYPSQVATKQYSIDGITWNTYTSSVIVTANNTTVYAKGLDNAGNQITQATLKITNIDKDIPIVTISGSGDTTSSITVTAVASDVGESGIDGTSYQYSKDNGTTWTTATNATSYTFTVLSTGTYNCKAKVTDNVGNVAISSSLAIATNELGTITLAQNQTEWTNEDVQVAITYPSEAITKQYSIDGITWNTYTLPVVVTSNNTTVYAKGFDNAGNQTTQATLKVSNIDKLMPKIVFGINGGTNSTIFSTTATAGDTGSGLNTSTLQYVWDTQNTTTPSSGWTAFTNGETLTKTADGTYYLWVKVTDNAGNTSIDKTNSYIVGETATPVTTIQTENKTVEGLTTGFAYNNPVIPTGFIAVNTGDASWSSLSTDWDKGLVIEDTNRNQFVWIPVDGTNVAYQKWCTTGTSYTSTSDDDTLPSEFSNTAITTTYQGFYIARYESAFDYNNGNIRVASKKSTNKAGSGWFKDSEHTGYLWNYINYLDSKTYAENMGASYGYDASKVGTNLVTGTEWDTVMKWVQNSGKSVTDSREWGNHSNSIAPADVTGFANLQISGYSTLWKAKNIYDLAGNSLEWTNEMYNSYRIYRGGNCSNSGSTSPAALRGYDNATYFKRCQCFI